MQYRADRPVLVRSVQGSSPAWPRLASPGLALALRCYAVLSTAMRSGTIAVHRYRLVPTWYRLVPTWYRLVPHAIHLVPLGTGLVPTWYRLVPALAQLHRICTRSLDISRPLYSGARVPRRDLCDLFCAQFDHLGREVIGRCAVRHALCAAVHVVRHFGAAHVRRVILRSVRSQL